MSTLTSEPLSALSTSNAPSTDITRPSTRAHCLRSPHGPVALPGELGAGAAAGGVGGVDRLAAGGAGAAAGVAVGAAGGATTTVAGGAGVFAAGTGDVAGGAGVAATAEGEGAGGEAGAATGAGAGAVAAAGAGAAPVAGGAGTAAAGGCGGALAAGAGTTAGATAEGGGAIAGMGAGAGAGAGASGKPPWARARESETASPAEITMAVTSCGRSPWSTKSATRPPKRTASAPWRRAPATSAEYTRPSSARTITTGSPLSASGHSTMPCRNRGSPGAAAAGIATRSAKQTMAGTNLNVET